MTDFFADPDRLRAIAPHFAALGEDVEKALEQLQAGIQKEGPCWGRDAPGKQFEKNYPQGRDDKGGVVQALAALAWLAGQLKDTGNKMTTVGNSVQSQDEERASDIRKMT